MSLLVNLVITGACLLLLGMYFNYRERRLHHIAEKKIQQIKEHFQKTLAERKVKEKKEIEKLKGLVEELEKHHKKMLREKNAHPPKDYQTEADSVIQKAKEQAERIEEEVRLEAQKFLEEQKKEVQTKMVDLVMGVTKKVLGKALNYDNHKELIEHALLEVEGESVDD
jgi:hypothetical protein